jgi:hypothetical protein
MTYKEKIRNLIRLFRYADIGNQKEMKDFVKESLGEWNYYLEGIYEKQRDYTQINDGYQKTSNYTKYRRSYEKEYRDNNRDSVNAKSIKCIYKKKYKDDWEFYFNRYLTKRDLKNLNKEL